jgi:hypothetical protein
MEPLKPPADMDTKVWHSTREEKSEEKGRKNNTDIEAAIDPPVAGDFDVVWPNVVKSTI